MFKLKLTTDVQMRERIAALKLLEVVYMCLDGMMLLMINMLPNVSFCMSRYWMMSMCKVDAYREEKSQR